MPLSHFESRSLDFLPGDRIIGTVPRLAATPSVPSCVIYSTTRKMCATHLANFTSLLLHPPHFGKVKKYMEASPHVTSLMFKDRGINVPTLSRSLGWHMTNAREPFELLPSTMPHTTKTFGMMGFFVHN